MRHRSYFKAQLVRAIYQMGISEWKRVESKAAEEAQLTRLLADKRDPQTSS